VPLTASRAPDRGHARPASPRPHPSEKVSLLVLVLIAALLAVVVLVLSAPLRAARRAPEPNSPERDELEVAR
jgi:hypothetical protein